MDIHSLTFDTLVTAARALTALRLAYDKPTHRAKNAQAYMRVDNSSAVLAIAGTNDAEDWFKSNLRAMGTRETPQGKVHPGFHAHSLLLDSQVTAFLNYLPPTMPLIVTGHSLGAAALTCLMLRRFNLQTPNVSALLFGSPRALKTDAATWFEENVSCAYVLNVQGRGDPVPTRPSAMLGYRHIGLITQCGSDWDAGADHPLNAYSKAVDAAVATAQGGA